MGMEMGVVKLEMGVVKLEVGVVGLEVAVGGATEGTLMVELEQVGGILNRWQLSGKESMETEKE